jgi:hypothetical protein
VRVVTETRGAGYLSMSDLRTFINVWDALAEFSPGRPQADTDAVEPTVMVEGQAGRFSKIQADLPT